MVPLSVAAGGPSECASSTSLGYCVEWDVPSPSAEAEADSPAPDCFWRNISTDLTDWNTVYVVYGVREVPPGVEVVWQEWHCPAGQTTSNYRWVPVVTPEALAGIAYGRVVGRLPQPVVTSSPPAGTPAIIGVPSFVAVANWTGTVSDQECAGGLCVTVTATPRLVFDPGEAGAAAVSCDGAGSVYAPGAGPPEVQAAASGACAFAYRLRTGVEGRPAEWPGDVSVTWTIGWTASSGASGSLTSVTRSTGLPRAVSEVQTVIAGGQTP